MKYRKGYKYQLAGDEVFRTSFAPGHKITTRRINMTAKGTMTVREGYAYDGPSGPVIDRKTNMRGACGHDALYQLMRMGLLPHYQWRIADGDFARWIIEDGAWAITAKIDLCGLRLAGGRSALPKNRKKIYSAP